MTIDRAAVARLRAKVDHPDGSGFIVMDRDTVSALLDAVEAGMALREAMEAHLLAHGHNIAPHNQQVMRTALDAFDRAMGKGST